MSPANVAPAVASPSVLLFESDDDTQEMYAVGLAMAGFQPLVAAGLGDAHLQMSRGLPDAVVVGTNYLDGEHWTLVHELKADARTRGIPVCASCPRATAGCLSSWSRAASTRRRTTPPARSDAMRCC